MTRTIVMAFLATLNAHGGNEAVKTLLSASEGGESNLTEVFYQQLLHFTSNFCMKKGRVHLATHDGKNYPA